MQMVWNALFVPLTAKKSKFGLGVEDGKFVNRLVGLASSNGEFEKLAQGLLLLSMLLPTPSPLTTELSTHLLPRLLRALPKP
jgi:hypothetical protein